MRIAFSVTIILIFSVTTAFAELSEAKRWAIALTGIMSEVNHSALNSLQGGELTPEFRSSIKSMLKRDWNIGSRDELIKTIEKMGKSGHQSELAKVQAIAEETKDYTFYNVISKYGLSQKQYNYLKFYVSNYSIYHNRSIIVWDWGRNIALCRWGYDCGYLTEDEAWAKIMYYAKLIQPLYNNWKDYGFDYYMGRIFWSSGFSEDLAYALKTDSIYRKMISENGIWSKLKWNVNLE